ncbi:tRNA pseudouridine(55) synthase TruB [Bacteroidota bacterium]
MTDLNFKQLDFQAGQLLLIDKPYKWTSFDIVKKIRYTLQNKLGLKKLKVGHAGTLDPLATGLLIICTGKSTKSIQNYMECEKEYIASIFLGATTPCFDKEMEIDKKYPTDHITIELLNKTICNFIGEQEQIPPVFSAKYIDGERAYEKARKGIDVTMKASVINISEIEIIAFDMPLLELRIVCSKGTYIRALARDIGLSLNSGAYLANLKRTRIGEFSLSDAINIEEFVIKTNIL